MGPGTSKEGSLISAWYVKCHWENFLPFTLFMLYHWAYRFDTFFFFSHFYYISCVLLYKVLSSRMDRVRPQTVII